MNKLREKLKNDNLVLYQALERSWEIAWEEWLPALGIQRDSYNSYPHLRNLENYLDQVVFEFKDDSPCRLRTNLSSTEIYLILAAILFHDIGRIHGSANHGAKSGLILKDYWAKLGVASFELAASLQKICEYHDCDPGRRKELQLGSVIIDPYGIVNELYLASLLILVDHLDSAFTRVLPQYLKSGDFEIIGAFRKVIQGVYLDHGAQMIRTELSNELSFHGNANDCANIEYSLNMEKIDECWPIIQEALNYLRNNYIDLKNSNIDQFCFKINRFLFEIIEEIKKALELKSIIDGLAYITNNDFKELYKTYILLVDEVKKLRKQIKKDQHQKLIDKAERLINICGKNIKYKIPKIVLNFLNVRPVPIEWFNLSEFIKDRNNNSPTLQISIFKEIFQTLPLLEYINQKEELFKSDIEAFSWYLVARGIFYGEKKEIDKNKKWPEHIVLATVMANIRANSEALDDIRNDLAAMGIPIRAWLIEYKEHLYNFNGQETYEPVFHKEYLKQVVESMWKLSTHVFGSSFFSYENLAAEVREPNLDRIKLAVRRIGIIANGEDRTEDSIWVGNSKWRWNIDQIKEKNIIKCNYTSMEEVVKKINALADPTVKIK